MKKITLPLFLMVFASQFASAQLSSHIMGAEITWTCMDLDTYVVSLTIYSDCSHCANPPCLVPTITVSSNCATKTYPTIKMEEEDITPGCEHQCAKCSDPSCTFKYGIMYQRFTTKVVVAEWRKKGCCELRMYSSLCCRNAYVTNGSAGEGLLVESAMNICLDACNNAPIMKSHPISLVCLGRDLILNMGALDHDIDPKTNMLSDSVVVSWARPMKDSAEEVSWSMAYSHDKPVYYYGFPKTSLDFPKGISLDSATGDLYFRPMKTEDDVVAVKLEEYRDNKLISSIRRDFQILVVKCPDNNFPVLSGINCKEPKPEAFNLVACVGEQICFNVCTSDKDKDDTVGISWNSGIPDASFSVLNEGDRRETGRFCWTPTSAHVSKFPYTFVVTAIDDGCPDQSITARSYSIMVRENPKVVYDTLLHDCGTVDFRALSTGKAQILQYQWDFDGTQVLGPAGDSHVAQHTFKSSGKYPYSLNILSEHGCRTTILDTINIPEFASIEVTVNKPQALPGDTIVATASVTNALKPFKVIWSTGETFVNAGGQVKVVMGDKDSIVFITATVDEGYCKRSDSMAILVKIPIGLDELDYKPSFEVWPNPTQDLVWIKPSKYLETSPLRVEIFALNGKMVYFNTFNDALRVPIAIDLGHLQPGMYRMVVVDRLRSQQTGVVLY
ncbi:MAG: hypothetical protein HYZ16_01325 [Bacteroidetes bacterium]|jgi:hypothetical protein|nr:hypothetical protein [Bacteroidota bacterium]